MDKLFESIKNLNGTDYLNLTKSYLNKTKTYLFEFAFPDDNIYGDCKFLNATNKFALGYGWAGIPFNFTLYSIVSLIIISLFGVLRRKAWKIGDHIPVSQLSWFHFIYGDREQAVYNQGKIKHEFVKKYEKIIKKIEDKEISDLPPNESTATDSTEDSIDDLINNSKIYSKNFIQIDNQAAPNDPTFQNLRNYLTEMIFFLTHVILIKNSDILEKKGPDAVHYLSFQKYVIKFLFLLTFLSNLVILPINWYGEVGLKSFARTTISNIQPSSNRLWVPVALSFVLFLFSQYWMNRFIEKVNSNENYHVNRTLLFHNIPKKSRTLKDLYGFFRNHFSRTSIQVEGIQFVYDTRSLTTLQKVYENAKMAKTYCSEQNKQFSTRVFHISRCSICPEPIDLIKYYDFKMEESKEKFIKKLNLIMEDPLNLVFITFENEKTTNEILNFFHKLKYESYKSMFLVKMYKYMPEKWKEKAFGRRKRLMIHRWEVKKAPYPFEIDWDNIGIDFKLVKFRRLIVQIIIVIILFLFSTPLMIVNHVNRIANSQFKEWIYLRVTQIRETYAPVVLFVSSNLLFTVISKLQNSLPHKTVTKKYRAIMWQNFFFLIMMNVILPSVGLADSANFVLKAIKNSTQTLECLFPVDNGAFFVNYMITSAFLTPLTLFRIAEVITYFFSYFWFTESEAEYGMIRQMKNFFDYQFHYRYTYLMVNFCIILTYSLACPVIVPFGLLFVCLKHQIDRYNIYYVYCPVKISRSIHFTAIRFFNIAILMQTIQMSTFITLRTGHSTITTISCLITFLIFLDFLFKLLIKNFLDESDRYLSSKIKDKNIDTDKNFCPCEYTAPVFKKFDLSGKID